MKRVAHSTLVGLLVAAGAVACTATPRDGGDTSAPPAIETAGPTLQLDLAQVRDGKATVLVGYNRRPEQIPPRIVELQLAVSGPLTFASAVAGDAVAALGKRFVAQATSDGVRLLVFSSADLVPLDSGWLAEVRFDYAGGAPATVSLANVGETFAPAEANAGFVPPEPLTVGGS